MSEAISGEVGETISNSTLKRLYGYDDYSSTPSPVTLDILSRYAGYAGFRDFCDAMRKDPAFVSGFISSEAVEVSALQAGDRVEIGWNPNRLVELKYLGDNRFRVVSSSNASLQEGDEFEALAFIKGYPMYLSHIDRAGGQTPMYVAGIQDGLTRAVKL